MQFNDYQQLAERTARQANDTNEKRFTNFAFGLAGETGEVIDCLKKHLFHGHPLDQDKLKIELGDLLWYVATTATTAGIRLEDIAVANIEKLRARYPDGFSEERSINRVEGELIPVIRDMEPLKDYLIELITPYIERLTPNEDILSEKYAEIYRTYRKLFPEKGEHDGQRL